MSVFWPFLSLFPISLFFMFLSWFFFYWLLGFSFYYFFLWSPGFGVVCVWRRHRTNSSYHFTFKALEIQRCLALNYLNVWHSMHLTNLIWLFIAFVFAFIAVVFISHCISIHPPLYTVFLLTKLMLIQWGIFQNNSNENNNNR